MNIPERDLSSYQDAEKFEHVPQIKDVGFAELPVDAAYEGCDIQLLRGLMEVAKLHQSGVIDQETSDSHMNEIFKRMGSDIQHQKIRDLFMKRSSDLEKTDPSARAIVENHSLNQVVAALKGALEQANVQDPTVQKLLTALTIQVEAVTAMEVEVKRIYNLPEMEKPHRLMAFRQAVGSLVLQLDNRNCLQKAMENFPPEQGWIYGTPVPNGIHGDVGIRYYEMVVNNSHHYVAVSNMYSVMFGFDQISGEPKHVLVTDHLALSMVDENNMDVCKWDVQAWRPALVDDIDNGYYAGDQLLKKNIAAYIEMVEDLRRAESGLILPEAAGGGSGLIMPPN